MFNESGECSIQTRLVGEKIGQRAIEEARKGRDQLQDGMGWEWREKREEIKKSGRSRKSRSEGGNEWLLCFGKYTD